MARMRSTSQRPLKRVYKSLYKSQILYTTLSIHCARIRSSEPTNVRAWMCQADLISGSMIGGQVGQTVSGVDTNDCHLHHGGAGRALPAVHAADVP
eukprot:7071174-Pyramimonas_sp.AAC.1